MNTRLGIILENMGVRSVFSECTCPFTLSATEAKRIAPRTFNARAARENQESISHGEVKGILFVKKWETVN